MSAGMLILLHLISFSLSFIKKKLEYIENNFRRQNISSALMFYSALFTSPNYKRKIISRRIYC